jgi:hypothetical protein
MILVLLIGTVVLTSISVCFAETKEINIPTQAENESQYINLSNALWKHYNEDLSCSSKALAEYVNANITRQEAFEAITSVIVLNSEVTDSITKLNPPKKYISYNENMVKSFADFHAYLFNLAKFYQTGNGAYALEARDLFNGSIEYHDKAIESQMGFK